MARTWRDLLHGPPCTRCGARSWVIRISPAKNDHELRLYECRSCGQIDHYLVSPGPSPDWTLIDPNDIKDVRSFPATSPRRCAGEPSADAAPLTSAATAQSARSAS